MKKKLLRERRALEITKDTNAKEIVIEAVEYDKESNTYIHNWLDGKEAESRKEYLRKKQIKYNTTVI